MYFRNDCIDQVDYQRSVFDQDHRFMFYSEFLMYCFFISLRKALNKFPLKWHIGENIYIFHMEKKRDFMNKIGQARIHLPSLTACPIRFNSIHVSAVSESYLHFILVTNTKLYEILLIWWDECVIRIIIKWCDQQLWRVVKKINYAYQRFSLHLRLTLGMSLFLLWVSQSITINCTTNCRCMCLPY